jgi:thiol:disulfide interchange protein DsbD
MKVRLFLVAGILSLASVAHAQEPVNWTYSARPIGGQSYEIHITASIEPGWHIYAQHQPDEAIAVPTSFSYTPSPLLALQGPTKEEGQLIHYKNDAIGVSQDQYADKVDFIQVVKLKGAVKTRISGTLTYQACTDKRCLLAVKKSFGIDLPPSETAN